MQKIALMSYRMLNSRYAMWVSSSGLMWDSLAGASAKAPSSRMAISSAPAPGGARSTLADCSALSKGLSAKAVAV
jgi:hypothetical protein